MTARVLEKALLDAVEDVVLPSKKVCIAYSGGLDSSVLLFLCAKLKSTHPHIHFHAIHVNHNLSVNAHDWQAFCAQQAQMHNMRFSAVQVDLTDGQAKNMKGNLEERARLARYDALYHRAGLNNKILLGHHKSDQAETLLLQLFRGAGPEGLSAMPKRFASNRGNEFCRPFLHFSRQALEQFARQNDLSWIEDESNQDERFTRNYVRAKLLPMLAQRWPKVEDTLSRSAEHCASYVRVAQEYVAKLALHAIHYKNDDCLLSLDILKQQSVDTQALLLRHWLKTAFEHRMHLSKQTHSQSQALDTFVMPSTAVLEQILLSVSAKQDAMPLCRFGAYCVRRYASYLYFEQYCASQGSNELSNNVLSAFEIRYFPFEHPKYPFVLNYINNDGTHSDGSNKQGPLPLDLKDAKRIALYESIEKSPLRVEYGGLSRKCRLHPKRGSKSLKTWLQEAHIPPWRRQSIPILMQSERILALGDKVVIGEQAARDSTQQGIKKPTKAYLAIVGKGHSSHLGEDC
ncbi:tRNA lysidine(34) synthetase TilS [Ningiella sp. W23]|uniref:tRNA lysidine(34) synthetase TilS n=1 Tax=Ningiella sp. W23 TaxID=3023715 RepID=UPI0037576378